MVLEEARESWERDDAEQTAPTLSLTDSTAVKSDPNNANYNTLLVSPSSSYCCSVEKKPSGTIYLLCYADDIATASAPPVNQPLLSVTTTLCEYEERPMLSNLVQDWEVNYYNLYKKSKNDCYFRKTRKRKFMGTFLLMDH
jgi:hypothetical protein